MRLLVDLGNTRAHLALSPRPGELTDVLHVPHSEGRNTWLPLVTAAQEAWIASVVPAADTLSWLRAHGLRVQALDVTTCPVPLDVATPETVGADRLANAVWALNARPNSATVVVDLGTAVTFELVDASGVFRGGAIAPGLRTQTRALNAGTAQLPDVQIDGPPSALGRDTPSAIAAGVYWGVVGCIDALTRHLSAPLESPARVVATGGDAARVALGCAAIDEVVPNLTLLGLSYLP